MRLLLTLMCLSLILINSFPGVYAEDADTLAVTETVVCDFDSSGKYYVSRDMSSFAYVKSTDKGEVVVFNGKEHKAFTSVSSVQISPKGKSIAYIGTSKGKSCVVIKGKAGKKYDAIKTKSLIFTGDGKHVLYVAEKDDQQILVDGKKELGTYDTVEKIRVSKEGSPFVYITREDVGNNAILSTMYLGGKEMKYSAPSNPAFSPNGKHFAFFTMSREGASVMVDNKCVCKPNGMGSNDFKFSEDSKSWGICADFQKHYFDGQKSSDGPPKRIVYINGDEKGVFEEASGLTFAKKSSCYAFFGTKKGVLAVYLNGKKYSELHGNVSAMSIKMSPNGKRIAVSTGKTLYVDKKSPDNFSLGNPFLFNSKSQFCNIKSTQGNVIIYVEGQQVAAVEGESGTDLAFNSDCTKPVFVVNGDEGKCIAIGEKMTGSYDKILYAQAILEERYLSDSMGGRPDGIPGGDVTDFDDTDSRNRRPDFMGVGFKQPSFMIRSDKIVEFYAIKDDKVVNVKVTIP